MTLAPEPQEPPRTGAGPRPTLTARLEAQRDQLFQANAVVSCCGWAAAQVISHDGGMPDVGSALETAYVLIERTAAELLAIAQEFDTERGQ